jgi:predicted outer membrane lipoprotein
MNDVWIAFLGVIIGGIFGLVTAMWDRFEARNRHNENVKREMAEQRERQRSHLVGVLLNCAHSTNDFLAAKEIAASNGTTEDERRDAHQSLAKMKSAWTEALVIVSADDEPRRTLIITFLQEIHDAADLGAQATVAQRGLNRLIGVEPPP